MNTKETFKEKRHHRFWLGAVMCRLFHPIETLENCSFVDSVSGKSVGKFRCKKCNAEYLANSKRDMFRCYV
jgi:hypothetical protein